MHKTDALTNLKVRPIVSLVHSFNYNLSQFMSELIQSTILERTDFVVKDVFDFVSKLRGIKISNDEIMLTLDIENLYPPIPIEEVTRIIVEKLSVHSKISSKTLERFLKFCTTEYCFKFRDRFFKQVKGVSMGTPIAPVISEVFLFEIDRVIAGYPSVKCYFRYVDDCFVIVKTS